ncbi:unnamed protein product [Menidia menidia]|uniref:(Atlantic silverside) hypothetical protein n=1 Tax=Menidia menidia TaxID=238744 RepID=A0A8S4AJ52_9TELE|nr:unnamed protein product [Menidia menidia]
MKVCFCVLLLNWNVILDEALCMMHQWDLSPFSVTPAARLLSRCVSVGAASQEEIDSAFSHASPSFSPHLEEAFQLQLELLRIDEQSADIFHRLGRHLTSLLREQTPLRQRLMKPLAHTSLPEKLKSAYNHAKTPEATALMDASCALLLSLATEAETVSSRTFTASRYPDFSQTSEPGGLRFLFCGTVYNSNVNPNTSLSQKV